MFYWYYVTGYVVVMLLFWAISAGNPLEWYKDGSAIGSFFIVVLWPISISMILTAAYFRAAKRKYCEVRDLREYLVRTLSDIGSKIDRARTHQYEEVKEIRDTLIDMQKKLENKNEHDNG